MEKEYLKGKIIESMKVSIEIIRKKEKVAEAKILFKIINTYIYIFDILDFNL